MLVFILVIIILVLLGLVVYVWREARRNGSKVKDEVVGIGAVALDRTVRKNKNKAKIVELLKQKGELSNSDIREQIGVSRNTVIRYMNQLEKEGVVEQAGNTGRSVVYRLKS